jgi:hypothetical protein
MDLIGQKTNQGTGAYMLSVVVLLEETVDMAEGQLLKSEIGMSWYGWRPGFEERDWDVLRRWRIQLKLGFEERDWGVLLEETVDMAKGPVLKNEIGMSWGDSGYDWRPGLEERDGDVLRR